MLVVGYSMAKRRIVFISGWSGAESRGSGYGLGLQYGDIAGGTGGGRGYGHSAYGYPDGDGRGYGSHGFGGDGGGGPA
jgi:hypothetical protein